MLTGNEMVSAYNGIIAALIAFGLLILPNRKYMKNKTESRLFSLLCTSTLISALSTVAYSWVSSLDLSWGHVVALIFCTIFKAATLFMVYQWVLYVDFRLYESRDQLGRRYKWLVILPAFFLLLLVAQEKSLACLELISLIHLMNP